jgi:uncharacterized protein (TIGR03000 family)
MYSMVLMAALTTGVDMPDFGRRGGRGCHGCYGGCYGGYGMGYGGCYGGYGMGYGGCYGGWGGGYGMGYGGCYGGWGGYGMNYGCGGYGMGYGGWGGHVWGGSPVVGGYAYSPVFGNSVSPIIGNYNTPTVAGIGNFANGGMTQSFYFNQGGNQANEATIIVHLPADATLTVDGQQTQSQSGTRVFHSPPLETGKTYSYELCAEVNRNGHFVKAKKTVEVQAGRSTEVTMNVGNRDDGGTGSTGANAIDADNVPPNQIAPTQQRRTTGSFPRPPRD